MRNSFALSAVSCLGAAACRAQDCRPYWTGLVPKSSSSLMVAFDDGSGPAIYVTGFFAGNPTYIDPVRRWTGNSFVPAGSGLQGDEILLSVMDDGMGPKLYYVAATPSNQRVMYRLVGNNWELTPPGMFVNPSPNVGTYIEPRFSAALPGVAGLYGFMFDYPAGRKRVVRWDGAAWHGFGDISSGGGFFCMAEFDTPGGPNLFVSGPFFGFTGMSSRYVVRWDGANWHDMGEVPGAAYDMITWTDPKGVTSLYIGWAGEHNFPPLSREGIARWTGTDWVSVGGGLIELGAGVATVKDMEIFDDGTGPALFVAGVFDRAGGAGGIPARHLAKWDGTQWRSLGIGIGGGYPDNLAVADDGRGPSLFVTGFFTSVGGGSVRHMAQYVGCAGNRQCYPDCDNNRQVNANDFICFINKYATKDPYANCDVSTTAPAINANDWICFVNKYAAGCS